MVEKIAVVGAGLMGYWHSRFAKSCGAQVEAVVDVDKSRAEALARKMSTGQGFDNLGEMLAQTNVSVVHICTPPATHRELIQLCLSAGKHVLVEKPLAPDAESTRELLACAREKKLLLNSVHQFPFQRGFSRLLEQAASLGGPVQVDFTTCSAGGEGRSALDRKQIMLEILPHPASLFFRLFPSAMVPEAFKVIRFTQDDLEISASSFAHGLSILISLRGRPTRNELTYIADNGSAFVDLFHGYSLFERGKVSRSAKMFKPLKFGMGMLIKSGGNLVRRAVTDEPAYPGLRELISGFYQAVDGTAAAPVSDEEMLFSARLADIVSEQQS